VHCWFRCGHIVGKGCLIVKYVVVMGSYKVCPMPQCGVTVKDKDVVEMFTCGIKVGVLYGLVGLGRITPLISGCQTRWTDR
jgi:hypothetical protein